MISLKILRPPVVVKANKKYFPTIGQSMCYFLIKHTDSSKKTTIENSQNEKFDVFLQNRSINPVNEWTSKTEQLISTYISNDKNGFIRTKDGVNTTNVANGKIKVLINDSKYFYTNNTDVEGYKMPKYMLFRMQPSSKGILDKTGELGASSQVYFLPLKQYNLNEIKHINSFFNSDTYNTLQKITTTGQYLKDSFVKTLDIDKIIKSSKIKHFITKKHRKGGTSLKSRKTYNYSKKIKSKSLKAVKKGGRNKTIKHKKNSFFKLW
jgi:hypothetical protein